MEEVTTRACRSCGQVEEVFTDQWGSWSRCETCCRTSLRQHYRFRADIMARFPMLPARVTEAIARHYRPASLPSLLAASDDTLLDMPTFGPKMLAQFRSVWPVPCADMTTGDAWRDHADMVAGVG